MPSPGSHAAMAADEDERISFCVGERFKSYQQLEVKIQQYEQQHFVKLWKRDCRTIQAAQRRVNRALSYEVTLAAFMVERSSKPEGKGGVHHCKF